MTLSTAFTALSFLAYLLSFAVLLHTHSQQPKAASNLFKVLFLIAIATHSASISLYFNNIQQGIDLSFYRASSLIFWLISAMSIIALAQKKPIENLLLVFLPLAALSLLCTLLFHAPSSKIIQGRGLISHVLLSLLAYSMLTIAAMQAILLAMQERQLRKHQFNGLFAYLPPLQTMESLLFDMIWLGFSLLSAAIVSGFFFIDDMFAQHLVHKTFFTIFAWCIFAILLAGRYLKGWRGQTAAKLSIAGFIALMLGYFGSKFVLEFLLS